jgi:basic amino acid/polyamine antiporter, APA family
MLRRSLGLTHATALVVGIIIGASIFVQPSAITASVPSVSAVYAVWIVAGVLTLFGALIAAELASAYPKAGGVYVFLSESLSPGIAFLWGWAMFWTMHTGIIAAVAMIFARYVAFFVPVGDAGLKIIAVAAVLVLSAVNYAGVRQGSLVQTTLTIAKVGAVAGITALAFILGPRAAIPAPTLSPVVSQDSHAFIAAIVAGLFAFGGWHMVTYAAEETVEPEKTLPRALVLGVLIVTASYIALNAAYFHVLPASTIGTSTRVASDAAGAVLGSTGAAIVSAIVAVSAVGALNGIILAGPRVYLAMARDRLLFSWAGAIHARYQTPHRAIALQALWAIVLVLTGTYRALFTRVVYTEWIFFALMAVGLVLLRRRQSYSPRFRIPWHPLVPVIFVLSSLYIVFDQVVQHPSDSLMGLGLVVVGLPVYYFTAGRMSRQPTTSPSAGVYPERSEGPPSFGTHE